MAKAIKTIKVKIHNPNSYKEEALSQTVSLLNKVLVIASQARDCFATLATFGFGFGWHAIVSEAASWAGAFRGGGS
ncbi:hypothetical protein H8E77_04350 [bacterium]|nr:hypothetical protein [bacterium]